MTPVLYIMVMSRHFGNIVFTTLLIANLKYKDTTANIKNMIIELCINYFYYQQTYTVRLLDKNDRENESTTLKQK